MENEELIEYERPKQTRVIFAGLLDFLLATLVCLCLFIGTKYVTENTSTYKTNLEEFNTLKLNSKIFIYSEDDKRIEDIVTFYNRSTKYSQSEIEKDLAERINYFISFVGENSSEKTKIEVQKNYDDFRLDPELNKNGLSYFIKDENGNIIKNVESNLAIKEYVENVYKVYIDEFCQAQFIAKIPTSLNLQKYFANCLLFIEIPIAVVLGVIVYFYIVPLIIFRGRKTLGRLAFNIGMVNKYCLNPNFWLFSLNFTLFLFEIVLSAVSFLIPMVISFSMEIFSKRKQNFHNYMTNIQYIDTNKAKIYRSKDEILLDRMKEKSTINFRNK